MNNAAEKVTDILIEKLERIEVRIKQHEEKSLRERWEFGRELLARRQGKKLPVGLLDDLCAKLSISRQEIQYRVQFASRFSDETELSKGIGQWSTWFQMIQKGLVQRKGKSPSPIGLGSASKREKTRRSVFAAIEKNKGKILNPKEWEKAFSAHHSLCLSVIPWVNITWSDGKVLLQVDENLRDICEGATARPNLNGVSLFAFLRQLRGELGSRRKEHKLDKIKRGWNPHEISVVAQARLLDWLEGELDKAADY